LGIICSRSFGSKHFYTTLIPVADVLNHSFVKVYYNIENRKAAKRAPKGDYSDSEDGDSLLGCLAEFDEEEEEEEYVKPFLDANAWFTVWSYQTF